MATAIHAVSSMATRALMGELFQHWTEHHAPAATVESVGGVEALRRVRAGEAFDVAILSSDAISTLETEGWVAPPGSVPLVESRVAMAVRMGTELPRVSTEAELRDAVLDAGSIGYSTGPSGVALQKLFQRWGIEDAVRAKTVQAPPGVPVGSLIADGRVELGFQQYSELMHLERLQVIQRMPPGTEVTTIFSAAINKESPNLEQARRLLGFLGSPDTTATKLRHGMAPA